MGNIVLYEDKKHCCGCAACMNVCPKKAISMQADAYGFIYPVINESLCVGCGMCKDVCGYQHVPDRNVPKESYATATVNEDILMKSASGGIFTSLAMNILRDSGCVYGVSMQSKDGKLTPVHERTVTEEGLKRMQGSKYVQSDISYTYQEAEKDLIAGRVVLFSGTPCQIAGLKKYLKKDYENLLTAEIICHGVPNAEMFQKFIEYKAEEKGAQICGFTFRDKRKGQGYMSAIQFCMPDGRTKEVVQNGKLLSFFALFLKSLIDRENCYSCPFACGERVADLTLGDFWGFHEEYPRLEKQWEFSNSKGVSCLLVNTDNGKKLLHKYGRGLQLMPTEFDKISKHNEQLVHPSRYSVQREEILSIYKEQGYAGVEEYYLSNFRKYRLKETMIGLVPKGLRRSVQRVMSMVKSH